MNIYYDFHIHTCLSPCGNNDMTPNNIVNMSVLKGLNVIAVTDHNSADNVRACIDASRGLPITVIPGIEIETAENIHMVCLFPDADSACSVGKIIESNLPPIKNKPAIFGEQIIMDSKDSVVGFKEQFLITACSFNIYDVCNIVKKNGGIAIPAHIDKNSYSILSNLGCIPEDQDFKCVEVNNLSFLNNNEYIQKKYRVLCDSDAHYLWDISEKNNYLTVPDGLYILHNPASVLLCI
ncbi:MAG: PHP domain-containing protein [Clostridia bacterium]|nr:PHP domain-containing protein [Clostridia bacterium]